MFVVIVIADVGAACAQTVVIRESNQTTGVQNQTPLLRTPILDKVIDGLSQLGGMTRGLQESAAARTQETKADTAPYVWARLSKEYLADFVEREVDREKPARDRILGITFIGTSRTTGQTKLVLHSNENQAFGEVVFEGSVRSRTTGQKGPATLYYLSNSTFRARKELLISNSGLKAAPAKAEAPTRLTPLEIRTNLPRLRGRIATRIAWRRVARSRTQADAIASTNRARDIREGLDNRLNQSVAEIQGRVQAEIAHLQLGNEKDSVAIRSRSTPEFIEVALVPGAANTDVFRMPTFEVAGDPDLAVRIHRTVIARVMMNPQLRARFAPIVAGVLQSRLASTEQNIGGNGVQPFSLGSEWFAIDVSKSAAKNADPRIAAENEEKQQLR
jgi:hypothetical protein